MLRQASARLTPGLIRQINAVQKRFLASTSGPEAASTASSSVQPKKPRRKLWPRVVLGTAALASAGT